GTFLSSKQDLGYLMLSSKQDLGAIQGSPQTRSEIRFRGATQQTLSCHSERPRAPWREVKSNEPRECVSRHAASGSSLETKLVIPPHSTHPSEVSHLSGL